MGVRDTSAHRSLLASSLEAASIPESAQMTWLKVSCCEKRIGYTCWKTGKAVVFPLFRLIIDNTCLTVCLAWCHMGMSYEHWQFRHRSPHVSVCHVHCYQYTLCLRKNVTIFIFVIT